MKLVSLVTDESYNALSRYLMGYEEQYEKQWKQTFGVETSFIGPFTSVLFRR